MLPGQRSIRRKLASGQRPHLLVGTVVGTLATYALFFYHYMSLQDDSAVWVWFGIRSDGRCGRDFATDGGDAPGCAKGLCCSSHGWCGHAEEYCSVALGCQGGCWAASEEDEAKRDSAERERHRHETPDDDEYMDRMHHYRYDDDPDGEGYPDRHHDYGRRNGGGHHEDWHDYHHHYDADPDAYSHHDQDHDVHGEPAHDHYGDDHGGRHMEEHDGPHELDREHDEHRDEAYHLDSTHHKAGSESADGPELVGLEEKRHLGDGDGVPLAGETPPVDSHAGGT